jgi:hypothetical protein
MQTNEADAVNGSDVSIGSIVRSPDGERWVVIDPCNLDEDLPTESFYWLGAVMSDDSRGVGKDTFETEDWEVLD